MDYRRLRILFFPLALIVGVAGGWLSTGRYDWDGPEPARWAAGRGLTLEETGRYLLIASDGITDAGEALILYPGGKVDSRAYLPVAGDFAERGTAVFIVRMPLRLAFFAPNRARRIRTSFPSVRRWYLGGHSLGGVAATVHAAGDPEAWDALILFAAYAPAQVDLSDADLPVLSVYGSADGLVPPREVRDNARRLPAETVYVNIDGGNHAGFGAYGVQTGDGEADISPEEQRRRIVTAWDWFRAEHSAP